jgi:hypothetical protein
MKFTWLKWSALPAAVLLAGSVAMAQDQTSSQSQSGSAAAAAAPAATPAPAAKPTVAQRKENQQDRIAQGVKSGQLTAGETSKLETKEAAINGETKADRAANGGKLTSAEKTQINGQQNQLSKQIYADKHNANTANPGNSKVGQRQENQQDRIADCRGNRQTGKSAKGHQPAGESGPRSERRQTDQRRKAASQQRAERRVKEHLQQEAQRQDAAASQAEAVSFPPPWSKRGVLVRIGAPLFCQLGRRLRQE